MQTAKDIMTADAVTVSPDTPVIDAAKLMLERHFNGLPVVDDQGQLVGVICQSDLVTRQKTLKLPSYFVILDTMIPLSDTDAAEQEFKKIAASNVEGVMTSKVITVSPETPLAEVANLMVDKKLHTLPVVENGALVGVIGKEDVLRTLLPEA